MEMLQTATDGAAARPNPSALPGLPSPARAAAAFVLVLCYAAMAAAVVAVGHFLS